MPQLLFQDTRTSISAPAALNSSAEMQRGGKWWRETLRLGLGRVVHLGLSVQPFRFARTGLTGLDRSELVKIRVVVGSFIFEFQSYLL